MSMLGATTERARSTSSARGTPTATGSAAISSILRSISPAGRRGPAALAEAMARWITHLLGFAVGIEPLTALRDAKLTWYVGLDAEATRMGDQLWHGEALDDRTAGRVLALFRLALPIPAWWLMRSGASRST